MSSTWTKPAGSGTRWSWPSIPTAPYGSQARPTSQNLTRARENRAARYPPFNREKGAALGGGRGPVSYLACARATQAARGTGSPSNWNRRRGNDSGARGGAICHGVASVADRRAGGRVSCVDGPRGRRGRHGELSERLTRSSFVRSRARPSVRTPPSPPPLGPHHRGHVNLACTKSSGGVQRRKSLKGHALHEPPTDVPAHDPADLDGPRGARLYDAAHNRRHDGGTSLAEPEWSGVHGRSPTPKIRHAPSGRHCERGRAGRPNRRALRATARPCPA